MIARAIVVGDCDCQLRFFLRAVRPRGLLCRSMTATNSLTADQILRQRIFVELTKIDTLHVAPSGNKRPTNGATAVLDADKADKLLDLCVELLEPATRARYLVEATERGDVPVEVDGYNEDGLMVERLLAKYAADRQLWARFPNGAAIIDALRAFTLAQVESYAPIREKARTWLRLSAWFESAIEKLDRTRAVLAAEQVGSAIGYPAPSTCDGKVVRWRDNQRRDRNEPDDTITTVQ